MERLVRIVVEVGEKRTFASALEWPGWCRSGRNEAAAIEALFSYAPRYAAVVDGAVEGFGLPSGSFEIVERLPGSASTDFGAPGAKPSSDGEPVTASDLARLEAFLRAGWNVFDRAAEQTEGTTLSTGPRGGGRDLAKIRNHVLESDGAYLNRLGGRTGRDSDHATLREAFIDALGARARGETPDVGPRGGERWSARFATRYAVWHTLDHTWEIEDRSTD
jgi:hypothetical protein